MKAAASPVVSRVFVCGIQDLPCRAQGSGEGPDGSALDRWCWADDAGALKTRPAVLMESRAKLLGLCGVWYSIGKTCGQ